MSLVPGVDFNQVRSGRPESPIHPDMIKGPERANAHGSRQRTVLSDRLNCTTDRTLLVHRGARTVHGHAAIQRSFASLVDNNNSLASDVTDRVPRQISLDLFERDVLSHSVGDLEETHRTQHV